MEEITGLMAVILVCGVIPFTAILAGTISKYQKRKLQMQSSGLGQEEKELLYSLSRENKSLRKRIENLESIISDMDMNAMNEFEQDKEDNEGGFEPFPGTRQIDIEV